MYMFRRNHLIDSFIIINSYHENIWILIWNYLIMTVSCPFNLKRRNSIKAKILVPAIAIQIDHKWMHWWQCNLENAYTKDESSFIQSQVKVRENKITQAQL